MAGLESSGLACTLLVAISVASVLVPPAGPPRVAGAAMEIIPYLATGYRYEVVPHDGGSGFEEPGFDDSTFSVGGAGFGNLGPCPLNGPSYVGTVWPAETDILLRRAFVLPGGVADVQVGIAIDNDVQVFVNGHDVSGGLQVHEYCAERDSFLFSVPDAFLAAGDNLLAVRGRDRGSLTYLDLRVTAEVRPCPLSQGFWKNHPAAWPVASLDLGGQSYAQDDLLAVLGSPPRGDASLILAHQLIAAKLNVANGSDAGPVSGPIADGDASLGAFSGALPYGVPPSSAAGRTLVSTAGVLDEFNNGHLTPLC